MNAPKPKLRWWRVDVSPKMLAILFLLGVIQYWAIGLLFVYGLVSVPHDLPQVNLAFSFSYFSHWSSVGGLIGIAVSRGRARAGLFGATIGLFLAAALMT